MNILIIEDEALAADKLHQMIHRYNPQYQILDKLRSVKKAVQWFSDNESPDLLFLDIHLMDGTCFDILTQHPIACPVVFTTAYDNYALEAFKLHSIDYLMKPISFVRLQKVFDKFESIRQNFQQQSFHQKIDHVLEGINTLSPSYKTRFLIKLGDRLFPKSVNHIQYFFSEDQLTFLLDDEGKKHPLSYTLNELETELDPREFFRINRQMIVHYKSILMVHKYYNGRLKIDFLFPAPEKCIVSNRRVADFQVWLDR